MYIISSYSLLLIFPLGVGMMCESEIRRYRALLNYMVYLVYSYGKISPRQSIIRS
jgi:hypothetical protein